MVSFGVGASPTMSGIDTEDVDVILGAGHGDAVGLGCRSRQDWGRCPNYRSGRVWRSIRKDVIDRCGLRALLSHDLLGEVLLTDAAQVPGLVVFVCQGIFLLKGYSGLGKFRLRSAAEGGQPAPRSPLVLVSLSRAGGWSPPCRSECRNQSSHRTACRSRPGACSGGRCCPRAGRTPLGTVPAAMTAPHARP